MAAPSDQEASADSESSAGSDFVLLCLDEWESAGGSQAPRPGPESDTCSEELMAFVKAVHAMVCSCFDGNRRWGGAGSPAAAGGFNAPATERGPGRRPGTAGPTLACP